MSDDAKRPSAEAHPSEPSRVVMSTSLGDLWLALDLQHAPLSCAAFLKEIDQGAYDDAVFFRLVRADNDQGSPPIDVVQAGSLLPCTRPVEVVHEPTSKTGLRHRHGTLSLPRADGGASTAAQLFICIGDQPALDAGGGRTEDGLGFAAFGRVIAGMDVVERIHRGATVEDAPTPYMAGQLAQNPVAILGIERLVETAVGQGTPGSLGCHNGGGRSE